MRHNNWSWWAATADETRVWWKKEAVGKELGRRWEGGWKDIGRRWCRRAGNRIRDRWTDNHEGPKGGIYFTERLCERKSHEMWSPKI